MDKEQDFHRRMKRTLDKQQPGDEALRDLRKARRAALDSATNSPRRQWLPAAALAGLILVVGGIVLFRVGGEIELPQAAVEDLTVIASEDEFELLEEFEFYLWFEQEDRV